MFERSYVMMFWAFDSNQELKTVEEVANGKACNCTCIECGATVWAKNGGDSDKQAHHFAHAPQTGSECSGEGALHHAAKYLLKEELDNGRVLTLPTNLSHLSRKKLKVSLKDNNVLGFVSIQSEVEKALSSELRVDCWAKNEHDFELAVEVFVTNKKTDEDVKKFEKLNQNAIEINLSKLDWGSKKDQIIEALFSPQNSKWLYFHDFIRYENEADEKVKAKNQKELDDLCADLKAHKKEQYELARYFANKESPEIDAFDIGYESQSQELMNALDQGLSYDIGYLKPANYQNNILYSFVQKKVKLTKVLSQWVQTNQGWLCEGQFNDKASGQVLITNIDPGKLKFDRPTAVFFWPEYESFWDIDWETFLRGDEVWQEKLAEKIEQEGIEKHANILTD